MAYTKTQWNPGSAPGISAENLNKIEQGIEDAHEMIENHENSPAPHSGHETPEGAQAKANTALAAAKAYTDQEVNEVASELESHKNDYVKQMAYATASGINNYTVTIPGITLLVEGLSVKIKFANENTGASTLNINGLGVKEIRKSNGNALSSGNIKAGQICHLVYTGSVFQLLGEGGEYGTAQSEHVLEGYTIGTEEGVVEGTMPNRGAMVIIPGPSYKWIPEGYHNGSGYVRGDNDLKSENIKAGVNIFGVDGKDSVVDTEDATASASNILSGKTAYVDGDKITGSMPNIGKQIITPSTYSKAISAGYHNGTGYVVGDSNLIANNIRAGVSIFGVVGSLVEGKQQATGTVVNTFEIDISNLSFTPSIVVYWVTEPHSYGVAGEIGIITNTDSILIDNETSEKTNAISFDWNSDFNNMDIRTGSDVGYIRTNGFYINKSYRDAATWFAFE